METEQELKKYNLKNDIVFKSFFSRKGNEEFLIDFLEGLLKKKIKGITIREEANVEQLGIQEKGGRLDLQAELDDGIIVNIELQMKNESNITKRTTAYGAKVMARSIERGTDYKNITKVIMINILGYNIFEYEEYVSKTVTVLDKHREYEVMDDIIYYFIELKKFRKQQANMDDKLNQWLAIIDDTDRGRIKMAETKNKILQKARTEINYIAGDANQRRIIELREKWEMDRISALNYAEARGEIRGERRGERRGKIRGEKMGQKQAKEKIAKNLLNQNIDIKIIISATGLTKKDIERLKMDMKKI